MRLQPVLDDDNPRFFAGRIDFLRQLCAAFGRVAMLGAESEGERFMDRTARSSGGNIESGSGSVTVSVDFGLNTATSPRTGNVYLASGVVLTIKQGPYPTVSCQYTPSAVTVEVSHGNSDLSYANTLGRWFRKGYRKCPQ